MGRDELGWGGVQGRGPRGMMQEVLCACESQLSQGCVGEGGAGAGAKRFLLEQLL